MIRMSDELVSIATFNVAPDAYIVKGMLEKNGIASVVEDDNNLYVPVFGGVRLLVRRSDAERAEALVNEFNS